MYFDSNEDMMVSYEEAMTKIKDLTYKDIDDINNILKEHDLYTFDNYNSEGLDEFSHRHTTPNGEQVVAFGKYGYNG